MGKIDHRNKNQIQTMVLWFGELFAEEEKLDFK